MGKEGEGEIQLHTGLSIWGSGSRAKVPAARLELLPGANLFQVNQRFHLLSEECRPVDATFHMLISSAAPVDQADILLQPAP